MTFGRYLNLLALALVNLLWALQFPAYKIASEHMGVVNLNFWTFVSALAVLLPFFWLERRRAARGALPDASKPAARSLRGFLLLGTVGIIPPSIFLAWGIAHSTAANAAIISLIIPVLTALMAVAMLGERMTRVRWLSFALAIAGTVFISGLNLRGGFFHGAMLLGNAVIFIAWMGSAFYNTYSKKLLEQFSELEVLVYSYAVASLAIGGISLGLSQRPFYDVSGYPMAAWGAIVVLGPVAWGLAMVLWMWVLKRLDVSQISVSIYLLPLFGVLLSAVTLHESITASELLGGGLVLIGTFLTTEWEARRMKEKPVPEPSA